MRLTKKISKLIEIPAEWTWDPRDDDGKSILKNGPAMFEIGPAKLRIWSLSQEEFCAVRDDAAEFSMSESGGKATTTERASKEKLFVARCNGDDGSWSGFENDDGEPLNCNAKNQARFAHHEGLRIFVCSHVGPILDNIAEGKASEEEKNSLKSLTSTAGGESGSTQEAAKSAGKPGGKK